MSKPDVSAGITGFIDILGFGDRVLNAEQIDDVHALIDVVARIRSAFDYSTRDKLTKQVHSIYSKTVLAFSDCVIINIPLQSDATEYEGTFDPIMSELAGFAYAQGVCALEKIFVRGGIDMGWWYRSGSTLISQSMVRAYKAEGRANVPVIALTPDLYNFFANHEHRNFYSNDADPITRILRKYEAGEGENHVEFWYLDYISICVESVSWQQSKAQFGEYRAASPDEKQEIMSKGYRENIDLWLSQHARNIEEAFSGTTHEKVKAKYRWLCNYHNDVGVTFTSSPNCLCHLP